MTESLTVFKHRFESALLTYQSLAIKEAFEDDIFFVLGKSTAWESEDIPPELDEVRGIPDPFLWVRVQQVKLALNDTLGTISGAYRVTQDLKGGQWSVFAPELYETTPFINEASHLYLTADVGSGVTSVPMFRAVALVAHPVLAEGVSPTLMQYGPSSIDKEGLILWRSFHSPIHINQTVRLEVIL